MKRTVFLVLGMLALAVLPALATEISVLFVGNSHTYANNMPDIFESLAASGYQDVYVAQSTVGGSTLEYHTTYANTLNRIVEREWDRVVLQEHSLFPVIDHWRDNSFHPSVRTLDSLITDTGSHTALYLTQGWKDAQGPYCIEDYCSPEFDGYFDMQNAVTSAYRSIGNELAALIVPCGEAWAAALSIYPGMALWATDGYHPSQLGSYLTACTFYAHIFNESPYGLEYFGGLDLETALFLQGIAWQVTNTQNQAPDVHMKLHHAYPNPFNPSTEIRFELDQAARVHLAIYDTRGRRVRELYPGTVIEAGEHGITWSGNDDAGNVLPSGVYLAKLNTPEGSSEIKLTLMK